MNRAPDLMADWQTARQRVWVWTFVWFAFVFVATLLVPRDWLGWLETPFLGWRFPQIAARTAASGLTSDLRVEARMWGFLVTFWSSAAVMYLGTLFIARRYVSLAHWHDSRPGVPKPTTAIIFLGGVVVLLNVAFVWLGLDFSHHNDGVAVDPGRYSANQMRYYALTAGTATWVFFTFVIARLMTQS